MSHVISLFIVSFILPLLLQISLVPLIYFAFYKRVGQSTVTSTFTSHFTAHFIHLISPIILLLILTPTRDRTHRQTAPCATLCLVNERTVELHREPLSASWSNAPWNCTVSPSLPRDRTHPGTAQWTSLNLLLTLLLIAPLFLLSFYLSCYLSFYLPIYIAPCTPSLEIQVPNQVTSWADRLRLDSETNELRLQETCTNQTVIMAPGTCGTRDNGFSNVGRENYHRLSNSVAYRGLNY